MNTTIHPVHPTRRTVEIDGRRKCVLRAARSILFTVQHLTSEQGCSKAFRMLMNCKDLGGQTMRHIHMHMHWPPN